MPDQLQNTNVRIEEIAKVFNLSVSRVRQMTGDGIIKGVKEKGKSAKVYPFIDTVQDYTRYLQDSLKNRSKTNEELNKAKLAETELKNRGLETKIALAEGRAHSTEDVRRVMDDMLGSFKARLWNLPETAGPKFVNIPDKDTAIKKLSEEIEDLCALLIAYNADDFYARNPDYIEGGVTKNGEADP